MTKKRKFIFVAFICIIYVASLRGQSTNPATGGNATGSGGSVSFTVGQVTYQTSEGTTGTVAQGVQQPYEISVVTAIGNTEGITLEYKVFPNPTSGLLRLIIKPFDQENFRYTLHDINSILLQDKKIESEETEISMDNYTPAVYFLQVVKDNQEVKVFKIIKK